MRFFQQKTAGRCLPAGKRALPKIIFCSAPVEIPLGRMSWYQPTVWRGLRCCSRGSRGYGGPSFFAYPSDMFFFMDPYRNQRRRVYDRTVGSNMQVSVVQQPISPSFI